MVATTSTAELIQSDDGVPLKLKLARAERMRKLGAFALVCPMFIFLLVTFIAPIFSMLALSVQNDVVPDALPKTAALIQEWDGTKWVAVSDWISPMRDFVRPIIEAAAVEEAAKLEYKMRTDCS